MRRTRRFTPFERSSVTFLGFQSQKGGFPHGFQLFSLTHHLPNPDLLCLLPRRAHSRAPHHGKRSLARSSQSILQRYYFEDIQEQTFQRVRVEGLQSFVEEWVRGELHDRLFDVDFGWFIAVDSPEVIGSHHFIIPNFGEVHLDDLSSLSPVPLLRLFRLGLVGGHPHQTIKHTVGPQIDMLDPFVVDAH